jgi:AmiR/NasT family two-component response regulator
VSTGEPTDREALIASKLEVAGLNLALDHRTTISAAVGILMERHKVDYEAAFAALVRASNVTNVRVYELATQLVTTGRAAGL